MADGPSLGDFFAKKKKKNLKGVNLNIEAAQPKAEEKKSKTAKEKDEEGWEEEEFVAPTMMVQVAGVLTKEEDTKEEHASGAAWGKVKKEHRDINERRFPTLAKAVGQSSNINIDDGSNPNINIKTSKNVFAALEDEDEEDDASAKRPKEIKPAMVKKQKGELQSEAIQREVSKYSPADKPNEKKNKKKDEEDDEEAALEAPTRSKKKKEKVKEQDVAEEKGEEMEAVAEDLNMEVDDRASRAKYLGREKLPTLLLSQRELQEEKKAIKAAPAQSKGKKKRFVEEEEDRPKLLVADWD